MKLLTNMIIIFRKQKIIHTFEYAYGQIIDHFKFLLETEKNSFSQK